MKITAMKLRTGICTVVAALMALTACSPAGPSAILEQPAGGPPKLTAQDAPFFMTVPADLATTQVLEVRAVETVFMSIAAMDTDPPLESWTGLGWAVGSTLGATDRVPQDCALHFRMGVAHQVYAACSGPAKVAIPREGGDFVYIIFTDTSNRIARVMQTGAKYNPDTTGLIP